jgi:hypothetical protein
MIYLTSIDLVICLHSDVYNLLHFCWNCYSGLCFVHSFFIPCDQQLLTYKYLESVLIMYKTLVLSVFFFNFSTRELVYNTHYLYDDQIFL